MLDLLSSLKEPKTKTLKLHGQSKTIDRPDGRAGRQLVRRLGGQTPSENPGGNSAPSSQTDASPLTQKINIKINPSPSLMVFATVLIRQPADSMNPT